MENDSENLMGLGERSFRCVLVKSNASSDDVNYHLVVVFNHSVGDGTSGMILANQIFTLYDEAVQNSEILEREINTEIVKTWREAIQTDIPDGNENYEVSISPKVVPKGSNSSSRTTGIKITFKKLQSDIDVSQAAFKDYLIPYSFEMKGKNAHVLRKGTVEGLKAFKAACKKNGVTIGIGIFTAVHWAMAKFDSSRDPFCFADVNLRHRLGNGPDKYKGVSCNIGMFKLSLGEKFDFDSGSVDFWEVAQALKKNIDMQMAEGNHFVYHRMGSYYFSQSASEL